MNVRHRIVKGTKGKPPQTSSARTSCSTRSVRLGDIGASRTEEINYRRGVLEIEHTPRQTVRRKHPRSSSRRTGRQAPVSEGKIRAPHRSHPDGLPVSPALVGLICRPAANPPAGRASREEGRGLFLATSWNRRSSRHELWTQSKDCASTATARQVIVEKILARTETLRGKLGGRRQHRLRTVLNSLHGIFSSRRENAEKRKRSTRAYPRRDRFHGDGSTRRRS